MGFNESKTRKLIQECKLVQHNIFVVTCPPVPSPSNGDRRYNKGHVHGRYRIGTKVSYNCNDRTLSSCWSSRQCQQSGNLNGQPRVCRGNEHLLKICIFFVVLQHTQNNTSEFLDTPQRQTLVSKYCSS